VHKPSDYKWWSSHGGVEVLRAELPKLQWICGFCHHLEKTGSQANRCGDPDDPVNPMPEGKPRGTPEEVAQYKKRRHATVTYPKQQYVDSKKLAAGECAHCRRVPTEETVWCFHWDHLDETTKLVGKDTLAGVKGGVSGIVHNHTKAAALDAPGVEEALDAEMAKCQLLCINCHHRKTNNYPAPARRCSLPLSR
jgi:5-methylcytosine-specific restriction endonuclease McrA